jgi:hypothetical protein
MKSFFTPSDRQQILDRFTKLQAGAARQWGKMDAAQMLAHCSASLEVAAGDVKKEQRLLGKVLARFVKGSLLHSDKPMGKNAPTDPTFVVADPRDFEKEKTRLLAVANRFASGGPAPANGRIHSFFGTMTGDEWGVLMWKHLDHHLRQFGT